MRRSASEGQVQRTSRLAVYTYFFEAGCTFASKVEPSGVKSGDA